MYRSNRLINIWLFLNQNKKVTAKEVAQRFSISLRTAQRDLEMLSTMGVPIYTERGSHGGYITLDQEILPPISFSSEEIASIIFTYDTLSYYQDTPYEAEVDSVKQKILNQVSPQLKDKLLSISKHVAMWNPKRKNINSPFIKELFVAAVNKKNLSILYASKDGLTHKNVIPIGVYGSNGFWYMPAYDNEKNKILLFRVDRVKKVQVGESSEKKLPTLKTWLNNISDNSSETTIIKVATSNLIYRQLVNYNSLQVIKVKPNNVVEKRNILLQLLVPTNEIDYFIHTLLSYGAEIKVISPQFIKDRLVQQALNILSIY